MLSEEQGSQAIGIPQVIRTPGKFFDMARFIGEEAELKRIRQVNRQMSALRKQIRDITASKALAPQEKRRRIDKANIQIVKLARQAIKTFRRAS